MNRLNAFRYLKVPSRIFSSQVCESQSDPNRLKAFIRDRIRSTGPITVAEYMSLSVRSAAGYYAQRAIDVHFLVLLIA